MTIGVKIVVWSKEELTFSYGVVKYVILQCFPHVGMWHLVRLLEENIPIIFWSEKELQKNDLLLLWLTTGLSCMSFTGFVYEIG